MPRRPHAPVRRPPRRRRGALVAAGAVATLLAGCGDGGGDEASMRSNVRGEQPAPEVGTAGSGGSEEFCAALARVDAVDSEDPADFLEGVDGLRSIAPEELADDLDVLAGVMEELADLDEDDPESFGRVMELVMAPEVQAASEALERYALDECGLELDAEDDPGDLDDVGGDDEGAAPGGTDPGGPAGGSGEVDLDLDDVRAVKDANEGASWVDKLNTTVISMDTDVQLAAETGAGLTVDEAQAACEAVRSALVVEQPAVTVEVRSGERVLAASSAGAACTPR